MGAGRGPRADTSRGCPRFGGRSIVADVPRLHRLGAAVVAAVSAVGGRSVAVGAGVLIGAVAVAAGACTTVDPGPDFVIPDQTFDADYFYCHVEPEVLFAKHCGDGDTAAGDPGSGCHYNSSAVSGMALRQHAPIDCGGGDHPVDRTQVGTGGAAASNLTAASIEMSKDYLTAPIVVRPSGQNHPRKIFDLNAPAVAVIKTWASR